MNGISDLASHLEGQRGNNLEDLGNKAADIDLEDLNLADDFGDGADKSGKIETLDEAEKSEDELDDGPGDEEDDLEDELKLGGDKLQDVSLESSNQLPDAGLDGSEDELDLGEEVQHGLDVELSDVKLGELEDEGEKLGDDQLEDHGQVGLEGSKNGKELLDIDVGDVGKNGFDGLEIPVNELLHLLNDNKNSLADIGNRAALLLFMLDLNLDLVSGNSLDLDFVSGNSLDLNLDLLFLLSNLSGLHTPCGRGSWNALSICARRDGVRGERNRVRRCRGRVSRDRYRGGVRGVGSRDGASSSRDDERELHCDFGKWN
ncbi:hypothetical protein B0T16DRAFT_423491 [Cercophora newfieldiana]|uniref:Uncharacterized protein n=1 Tax=Cercophora newfieldiana TaxID=92897 RepID=A0AA40CJP4_9PEZI|nr:hypothetical protein B0T16DRAFT_423491 [Cercophora newfieldiana]